MSKDFMQLLEECAPSLLPHNGNAPRTDDPSEIERKLRDNIMKRDQRKRSLSMRYGRKLKRASHTWE